jgi:hypothetical protein
MTVGRQTRLENFHALTLKKQKRYQFIMMVIMNM